MRAQRNGAALALSAALAVAAPGVAVARRHVVQPVASSPPSFGYYGQFPLALDYAQAQAWSLREPYYQHFPYDYCDYRNCRLELRAGHWAPVWFAPAN